MRKAADATVAAPYLATWTAANIDISSTTAGTAPVELAGLDREQYVNLCLSGDTTGKTFSWQLCLVEESPVPRVVRVIEFTTAAGVRRSVLAGSSGHFMHADKVVDIGGLSSDQKANRKWVLALAGIDTDTGAYLLGYAPITGRAR